MTTNFARHEQFLRIWKLLEVLDTSRLPVADGELVAQLKESLGLASLSHRTLGRDCEFLASCGYPVERRSLPETRKQGWQLNRQDGEGKRWMPREPLTLLEVTAFLLSREQLRFAEGTVLWSGIESLWNKIDATLPSPLANQVAVMNDIWHVDGPAVASYADRPRLLSMLCGAVSDCCEVALQLRSISPPDGCLADEEAPPRTDRTNNGSFSRFQPCGMVVRRPCLGVIGFPATERDGEPVLIDLTQIDAVEIRDKIFPPNHENVRQLLSRAVWPDGTPVTEST